MCAITLLCFVCYKNRIGRVYLNFFNLNPHWIQFIPIPHNKLRDAINPHPLLSHKTHGRILTLCWRAQGGKLKRLLLIYNNFFLHYYYIITVLVAKATNHRGFYFVSPLKEFLSCISAKRQKTSNWHKLFVDHIFLSDFIQYISFEQCHPLKSELQGEEFDRGLKVKEKYPIAKMCDENV